MAAPASTAPPGMGPAPASVHLPGGDLISQIQHPDFRRFEQRYSKQPESSWFAAGVSGRRPVSVPIGTYTVPKGMDLWLRDYEFMAYRFSGVEPGDFVRLEEGRLQGCIGFDITVNGSRDGDLRIELEPQPPAFQQGTGRALTPSPQSATGAAGLSLLPLQREVQGARYAPFTMICGETSDVTLSAFIFRTISLPLAAIVGRIAGFMVQTNVSKALLDRARPR